MFTRISSVQLILVDLYVRTLAQEISTGPPDMSTTMNGLLPIASFTCCNNSNCMPGSVKTVLS